MKYKIFGGQMPAVTVRLDAGESVYTQSGGMSWMTEGITMDTNLKGGLGKSLGRQLLGQQAEEQGNAVLIQVLKQRRNVRAVHGDQDILQGLVLLFLHKYSHGFFYRDTVFCHLVILLYEVCSGWEADTQAKVLFRL